jgi:hypothetical protein
MNRRLSVNTLGCALLALSLYSGAALAQSGSSGSGASSPSAPGAAGSQRTPGAPALAPTPSAPATPPKSNTDVYPPSRVLPPASGAASPSPSTAAPGNTGPTSPTGPSPSTALPGKAPPPQGQATTETPASGGRPKSGGAGSSAQSTQNPTAKNELNERIADCLKLWDRGTHMSKQAWRAACQRTMNRIENMTAETTRETAPKKR